MSSHIGHSRFAAPTNHQGYSFHVTCTEFALPENPRSSKNPGNSHIFIEKYSFNPLIFLRKSFNTLSCFYLRGTIVCYAQLPVLINLILHRLNRLFKVNQINIVYRHNYADFRVRIKVCYFIFYNFILNKQIIELDFDNFQEQSNFIVDENLLKRIL